MLKIVSAIYYGHNTQKINCEVIDRSIGFLDLAPKKRTATGDYPYDIIGSCVSLTGSLLFECDIVPISDVEGDCGSAELDTHIVFLSVIWSTDFLRLNISVC